MVPRLRPASRLAGACLAAGLTSTMLAAFLLPGTAVRPRAAAPAPSSGPTVVYAWTPGPGRPERAGSLPSGATAAAPELRPLPAQRPAAPAGARPRAPVPAEAEAEGRRPGPTPETNAAGAGAAAGWPAEAPPSTTANTAGAPAGLPVPVPAPARAASAPLRLDRSVVREASRTSRSSVQQMAEAAGQTAGDAPVSGSERLADSVARTVKPDCLPPGGAYGLLTPLVAAYKMATDTCRNR